MMNVIDWDAVVESLERYNNPKDVSLGLANDWFWTAGDFIEGGKLILDHQCYLHSNHDYPTMEIENQHGDCIRVSCWKSQDKGLKSFIPPIRIIDQLRESYD